MSQARSQDETATGALGASPGCGARYIEHLERFPERDLEPGVVRRARALVRAVLDLRLRVSGQREGDGSRKAGGKAS
jgi:hypothetical protein